MNKMLAGNFITLIACFLLIASYILQDRRHKEELAAMEQQQSTPEEVVNSDIDLEDLADKVRHLNWKLETQVIQDVETNRRNINELAEIMVRMIERELDRADPNQDFRNSPPPTENYEGPIARPDWFTHEHENLLRAIAIVESNDNPNAVGDGGKALGAYQIWYVYWQDAIRHIPSIGGEYVDVIDTNYARQVVIAYWDRYGHRVNYSLEGLARIHNGGPTGYRKNATVSYWNSVRENL